VVNCRRRNSRQESSPKSSLLRPRTLDWNLAEITESLLLRDPDAAERRRTTEHRAEARRSTLGGDAERTQPRRCRGMTIAAPAGAVFRCARQTPRQSGLPHRLTSRAILGSVVSAAIAHRAILPKLPWMHLFSASMTQELGESVGHESTDSVLHRAEHQRRRT
jgi:hypothetical protein